MCYDTDVHAACFLSCSTNNSRKLKLSKREITSSNVKYNSESIFCISIKPSNLIQDAVQELNAGKQINIKTWEKCSIGGKFVIDTICTAINEASLFFADLTGLNANVMFELGYAIARDKRIWLIFDETYTEWKKMFDQLKVLTTVGYIPCCNSSDIVSGFYANPPIMDIGNTIYRTAIEPNLRPGGYQNIFYLKSQYENQAAMRMSRLLEEKLPNKIIIDDPRESTVQTLTWYGSRVFDCRGLVCHFTNPDRKGAYLQTARHALVCGMAHGSGIPLLMLAEGDFLSPIDYRDYLKHYNTARDALEHLEEWLSPIEESLKINQQSTVIPRSAARLETDLKSLHFGEYIAEYEAEGLIGDYFIQTAAYDDAAAGNHTVFVGRKGSGKTANLMKLEDELSKPKQNIVCVIKPQPYQMQGIVDVLKSYQHRNVKGYTIESLWKFLLLTEIANTLDNLENHSSEPIGDIAQSFFNFVEKNKEIIRTDFSTRLELCTQSLEAATTESNDKNSYLPVSEALHSGILKQLRVELGNFLSSECTAIGNLDHSLNQDCDTITIYLKGAFRWRNAEDLPPNLKVKLCWRHFAVKLPKRNCVGATTSVQTKSRSGSSKSLKI